MNKMFNANLYIYLKHIIFFIGTDRKMLYIRYWWLVSILQVLVLFPLLLLPSGRTIPLYLFRWLVGYLALMYHIYLYLQTSDGELFGNFADLKIFLRRTPPLVAQWLTSLVIVQPGATTGGNDGVKLPGPGIHRGPRHRPTIF